MGYNGGTNKRGYYRRYNGMYSKSSYRSGEKILSNFLFGGLGLLAAGASALSDLADNAPDNLGSSRKHFSASKKLAQYIIWGIFALACPIASFATFTFAYWPIFFSILLFGIIEFILCAAVCSLENELTFSHYYYKDEIDSLIPACKKNLKILMGFLIALLVLNLYPIVYLILDLTIGGYFEWEGGEGLTMILYCIKIFTNGFIIYMVREDYKNAETIIEKNASKRSLKEIKQMKAAAKNIESTVASKPTQEQDIQITNKTNEEAEAIENEIDLTVKPEILTILQKDYRIESFYYFYEDLMSESSFCKQQFSIHFKQIWFTYADYVKYWKQVHWKLRFYEKAYILSEDIILNDTIRLEDFQDEKVFAELVDNLLKERLCEKERKAYNDFISNKNYHYECLVLHYPTCRYYKLEAQENVSRAKMMIDLYYKNCIQDVLKFRIYNDRAFNTLNSLINTREANTEKPVDVGVTPTGRIDVSSTNTVTTNNADNQPDKTVENLTTIIKESDASNVKLPKISGEYVEAFKSPYGKLHINSTYASIQFYFPGPDARYRGTHFTIWEEDIDKYIKAYQNNWETGIKLREKAKETPKTELKQVGEMSMNIVATAHSFTIYLHRYHLPIYYKKDYEEMVMLLQRAKLRIIEVRSKLFA